MAKAFSKLFLMMALTKLPSGTVVKPNPGATAPGGMQRFSKGAMKPMTAGRNVLQYARENYQGNSITESKIRVEVLLTNANNSYQFNILKNPGVDSITETKLDKNDVFVTNRVGFFLTRRTDISPGNEELLTFPNNSLLDGVAVVVKDFYTIYNGTFQVTIGTNLVYPSMPMEKFLYVPQTQQDSISAAVAGTPNTTYGPFENERDSNSGFFEISNILELSGGADNILQVNVLQFPTMAIATTTAGIGNYIVMILDGFLVKNAAYRGLALQG